LLLESKFLHEFKKNIIQLIILLIITFIVVKVIIGQKKILVIINYRYNNLLEITLIFIITVKLL